MRNLAYSKLIYFLAALSGEDRVLFREYLHSPVFNHREEPRLLYDHVVKKCLKDPPREMDDRLAIAAVWPGEGGDVARLQKVKNALMTLLVSFLEFRHWRGSGSAARVGMLHQLNALREESYFDQYYRKVKANLDEEEGLDFPSLSARLDLEVALMEHKQQNGIRTVDNHLDASFAAMEKVVHGHVLRFAFVIANQTMIVGGEMPAWVRAHIERLDVEDVADEPLLEIYYLLYHTLWPTATMAQLTRLKEQLLHYAHRCAPQTAMDIYVGTINNYSRYAQASGENLLGEIFETYQSLVETVARGKGLLLNRSHFKNIVHLGSRLGHFEWVSAFLDEGKDLLDAEDIATTLDYNMGVYCFYKGSYKDAERCFNRVMADVKDVFYAFDVRMFLLMSFFETGDSLGMESMVHSFRMLLERSDRVSELHKNLYLSFLRVFRKLLGTPLNDQFRLRQLKAEIDLLGPSAGKAWLLEKVG